VHTSREIKSAGVAYRLATPGRFSVLAILARSAVAPRLPAGRHMEVASEVKNPTRRIAATTRRIVVRSPHARERQMPAPCGHGGSIWKNQRDRIEGEGEVQGRLMGITGRPIYELDDLCEKKDGRGRRLHLRQKR
jgi:hypothetical protein